MTLELTQVAWAAGYFEARGSVAVQLNPRHWPEIQISIRSPELEPITRWHATVCYGQVHGPLARTKARPVYEWRGAGFADCFTKPTRPTQDSSNFSRTTSMAHKINPTRDGQHLIVIGPYDPTLIAQIKKRIPPRDREWRKTGKFWKVRASQRAEIEAIVAEVNA